MPLERGELSRRKRANRSCGQRTEPKRTEPRARQCKHRMPQRFEHPPDLPVPALVKRQIDDAVVAANGDDANLRPGSAEIVEPHATLQRAHVLCREPARNRGPVGLLHAEARVQQAVSEFAVVRQQKDPTGTVIEASDRNGVDAARKQFGDGSASLRIAHRRHHAGRFVCNQVGKLARRLDDSPFDFNMIRIINESSERTDNSAVNSNRPFNDQVVGMAPRRNPGLREIPVKANPRLHA